MTSPQIPRRLPPTSEMRLRSIIASRTALSSMGQTRAARPVPARAPRWIIAPPDATGGGVVGSVYYTDPATTSATQYTMDPSSFIEGDGDTSGMSYTAGSPGGSPPSGIEIGVGWFQAGAQVQLALSSGQTGCLVISVPTNAPDASSVILPNGPLVAYANTSTFYNDSAGRVVSAQVYNPDGASMQGCALYVVQIA